MNAADFDFWKAHPPRVELRPEDNLHVEYRVITSPWLGNFGPRGSSSAPIVRVRVTAESRDFPSFSSALGKLSGILSPIASLIPTVGPVLSLGIGLAGSVTEAKTQAAAIRTLTKIPVSAFAPTIAARPFYIMLPLDDAQQAVLAPWRTPSLLAEFDARLASLAEDAQSRAAAVAPIAIAPPTVPTAGNGTAAPKADWTPVALIAAAVVLFVTFSKTSLWNSRNEPKRTR